jgi:glycerophosphoryl diester phosphodiesterase
MKRRDTNRTLIFAHRGANREAPENTLPAFQAALDMGVDGVELDVQYSSDGRLMIFHDFNLETISNGAGSVTSHTFEELRALDVGSSFGPQFAGTCMPVLEEVLDLLKGRLLINIELKSFDMASTLGHDVVEAVRARDMAGQVVLSSFNPFTLRRAKTAGHEIECAYLTAPDLPYWMRSGLTLRMCLADGLHPDVKMVDAAYMARARKRRMPVRVWTVNEEEEMRRMIELGVDAIITDAPEQLKALLD